MDINEQDFKDGQLVSEITGICNVWNTAETNARLRKFINDFRAAVLKDAAERGRVYISEFNDEVSRFGEMRVTEQELVSAIIGDHAPTFMGLPVFDSQPAGPMLGIEQSGSNELLKQRGVTLRIADAMMNQREADHGN